MLSVNVSSAIRSLAKTAADLQPGGQALEGALDAVAQTVKNEEARQVEKTYKRTVQKTASGRPSYVRSGDLRNGIEVESAPGERRVVITGNASKPITNYPEGYAQKLATIPVSKDGVARANDFAPETVKVTAPIIQPQVDQELRNRLR